LFGLGHVEWCSCDGHWIGCLVFDVIRVFHNEYLIQQRPPNEFYRIHRSWPPSRLRQDAASPAHPPAPPAQRPIPHAWPALPCPPELSSLRRDDPASGSTHAS